MPRSEYFLLKQTYPYRDHKLALKILRILNKKQRCTTNEIRDTLGVNSPYSQKIVRHTLERLNELGYCQEDEEKQKRTDWMSIEELNKLKHYTGNFNPEKLNLKWERINGFTFHKKNSSNYVLCRITIDGKKLSCIEYRLRKWGISFKGKLLLLLFEKQSFRKFFKKNLNNSVMNLAQILLNSNKNELVDMLIDRLEKSYIVDFDLEKIAIEWYDNTMKSISKMSLDGKKYPELSKLKSEIIDNNERMKIMRGRNL